MSRSAFHHRIRQELPLKVHRIEERVKDSRGGAWYDSRFGRRHSGQGNYWEAVDRQWGIWTERLGFNEPEEEKPEQTGTFRPRRTSDAALPRQRGRCRLGRRPDPGGQIQFDWPG